MIAILIFLFVVIILIIEAVSVWGEKRQLKIEFDLDTSLIQPGETAVLHYAVSNPHRMPFLYAGFSLFFDKNVTVCEDGDFRKQHITETDSGTIVNHSLYLPSHSRFSGKVRFTVSSRGIHEPCRYFLETGDYLGIFPTIITGRIGKKVICTSETADAEEIRFPGGEMGDISVRRFIIDDPTVILGYREYTGREPMKQISWTQTAKAGKLMVRQNDFTTDQVAVVMVNMYSAKRPLLEECLKLVRTVCEQLEEKKIPYELMSNGDLLSIPEGIGREHLFFILRRIGLSRLMGFMSFGSLVDRCTRRRRSNCCYIVITPSVEPEMEAQIAYLGRFSDVPPVVIVPDEKEEKAS